MSISIFRKGVPFTVSLIVVSEKFPVVVKLGPVIVEFLDDGEGGEASGLFGGLGGRERERG